jgi:hypothetical protein
LLLVRWYWHEDKTLDRIRVTKELVNHAEVQLIGYGKQSLNTTLQNFGTPSKD